MAYSDGYIQWTGSKHREEALDVIAYLATQGQQVIEQTGGRSIPAYKPTAEGLFLQRPAASGTGGATFTKKKWFDALKGAKLQPLVVPFDDMSKVFDTHEANVLAGKESAREAVAAIEREVNVLLDKSPMPKAWVVFAMERTPRGGERRRSAPPRTATSPFPLARASEWNWTKRR